ncbi:hypothetical protein ACJX0J_024878, partial [Zea mays]
GKRKRSYGLYEYLVMSQEEHATHLRVCEFWLDQNGNRLPRFILFEVFLNVMKLLKSIGCVLMQEGRITKVSSTSSLKSTLSSGKGKCGHGCALSLFETTICQEMERYSLVQESIAHYPILENGMSACHWLNSPITIVTKRRFFFGPDLIAQHPSDHHVKVFLESCMSYYVGVGNISMYNGTNWSKLQKGPNGTPNISSDKQKRTPQIALELNKIIEIEILLEITPLTNTDTAVVCNSYDTLLLFQNLDNDQFWISLQNTTPSEIPSFTVVQARIVVNFFGIAHHIIKDECFNLHGKEAFSEYRPILITTTFGEKKRDQLHLTCIG